MCSDERFAIVERARRDVDVGWIADVAEHYGRVALEPAQLRAFHRRALERRAKTLIIEREQVARQRPGVLSGDCLARRERIFAQTLRELLVPRAHLLTD